MSTSPSANSEQIAYWNEISGPKWVELSDRINDQIEPLGLEAIDRLETRQGHSVLDVGCGCGQTTLALAGRVGAEGRVQGIDISEPMLADSRRRAQAAGAGKASFLRADAQTHDFGPDRFDRIFSRFGVMFFDDPVAAFANLRTALAPGGRLGFICWQPITSNPWMLLPAQAAAQHVELPAPSSDPHAPGPFSFGDSQRVLGILGDAGFEDARCDAFEGELAVGRGLPLDEIVLFLQQMGPAGAALRDAPPEIREKASRSMREILEPHYRDDAVVLDFACWIATAR